MTITINNQTFDLTSEQVNRLKKALNLNSRQLSEIAIGDTFEIGGIEFIKFSEENGIVQAVTKNILFNAVFDKHSSNFSTSALLKKLENEVLPKIEEVVGTNNVLEFITDLTSLDGLDDYGTMKSKISLPTFDFYRKHVKIFDKYKVNKWWWLSTPDSTLAHGYRCTVRCVYDDGALGDYGCYDVGGVRPFLTFKSSIFVS